MLHKGFKYNIRKNTSCYYDISLHNYLHSDGKLYHILVEVITRLDVLKFPFDPPTQSVTYIDYIHRLLGIGNGSQFLCKNMSLEKMHVSPSTSPSCPSYRNGDTR